VFNASVEADKLTKEGTNAARSEQPVGISCDVGKEVIMRY